MTNALKLRLFNADYVMVENAGSAVMETMIKEEKLMETVIKVNGMMCPHCKARVETVCKSVDGCVDAVVDLQKEQVTVIGDAPVEALKKEITNAGYEVVE